MNKVRCAIYVRKSNDDGLEKDFNTLEAQYEACHNYIKSQIHQGWVLTDDKYEDVLSEKDMKRPSLQRLLNDIENGKIDMIVVYKIDRLSRLLYDFSHLITFLEKHNCSFVSITQNFNTKDA